MNLQDKFVLLGAIQVVQELIEAHAYKEVDGFNKAYSEVEKILEENGKEDDRLLQKICPDYASNFRSDVMDGISIEIKNEIIRGFECLKKLEN